MVMVWTGLLIAGSSVTLGLLLLTVSHQLLGCALAHCFTSMPSKGGCSSESHPYGYTKRSCTKPALHQLDDLTTHRPKQRHLSHAGIAMCMRDLLCLYTCRYQLVALAFALVAGWLAQCQAGEQNQISLRIWQAHDFGWQVMPFKPCHAWYCSLLPITRKRQRRKVCLW